MEFLYIWINEYHGIKKVGLNISNEYRFHFNELERQLSITNSENFIPSFFADSISSLTAIIGENGSGKTTLLRYIVEYLSDGINNHKDEQSIVVFKRNNKIHYFSHFSITITSPNNSIKLEKINDNNKIRDYATTVFLSNTFNPTSYNSHDYLNGQLGKTKNLSTQYLLYADYQNRTGQDAFNTALTYQQRFSSFAAEELIRIVRLLRWLNYKEAKGHAFPVKPPEYLNISLVFSENEEFKSELEKIARAAEKYFNITRNKKNKFLIQVFLASVYHFINEIKFISGPEIIADTYGKVPSLILEYFENNEYKNHPENSVVPEMHDIFYSILRKDQFSILNDRISQMQAFLELLGGFVHTRSVKVSKANNLISVVLTKANKADLEKLVEEYYKTERIAGYVDFYFSHQSEGESSLSSGEYAMLTVFARLNSMKVESRKPLLILMDEAELALHPQWQKEFVYHFVDFISERFASYQVQIIITAHSPFILSDIPPHCVVLLKRGNHHTVVVDSLESNKETFGANIHELFTDSFFLQDGLMGEFSRRKIQDLIKEIGTRDFISLEEFENRFKKRINIIGEPFIKSKILELVADKSDISVIDQIITQRNEEIELLQQIKKQKGNDKNRTS
ncbi:AAA family ATPase [Filimonas effusa]|uniref:ATP-binding cassette domain-containing protein n=1 Tax=Filimonas effusa TaxID=2508721 RepID=A0A4Q1DDS4_9BACT|nr:AAA family ATPase [Filimonas effusa]RXK87035.1 ATP-binding cassette domain-containing protein [Filimonas effusa]